MNGGHGHWSTVYFLKRGENRAVTVRIKFGLLPGFRKLVVVENDPHPPPAYCVVGIVVSVN